MDASIPVPNPFVVDYLIGAECRGIITERTHTALWMYQAEVAKRTGALARSAHASVHRGGLKDDRWVGTVTVGDTGITGDYALAHEFGAEDRHEDDTEGAHDLNTVLETMIWMPM